MLCVARVHHGTGLYTRGDRRGGARTTTRHRRLRLPPVERPPQIAGLRPRHRRCRLHRPCHRPPFPPPPSPPPPSSPLPSQGSTPHPPANAKRQTCVVANSRSCVFYVCVAAFGCRPQTFGCRRQVVGRQYRHPGCRQSGSWEAIPTPWRRLSPEPCGCALPLVWSGAVRFTGLRAVATMPPEGGGWGLWGVGGLSRRSSRRALGKTSKRTARGGGTHVRGRAARGTRKRGYLSSRRVCSRESGWGLGPGGMGGPSKRIGPDASQGSASGR